MSQQYRAIDSNIMLHRSRESFLLTNGGGAGVADNNSSRAAVLGRLRADHDEIKALFCLYEEESALQVREYLLGRLCSCIKLHCTLEAGVFVPAVAEATGDLLVLGRTGAEYAGAMQIINETLAAAPDSERRNDLFSALKRYVYHHVSAAESAEGIFAQAQQSALPDWQAVERELIRRRKELTAAHEGAASRKPQGIG